MVRQAQHDGYWELGLARLNPLDAQGNRSRPHGEPVEPRGRGASKLVRYSAFRNK